MSAYPEYRESGLTWLSQVPTHWEIRPPKHFIEARAGGTLIKGQCASEAMPDLYPGYSASGQDVWLPDFDYDCAGLVLSAVGARCGKTFKADGRWGVVANTGCLLPRSGVSRDFVWYLTNNEDWWEKGGTAQPFTRVSDTLARNWAFPPPAEQSAIASFLDRETGKIDALVAEQERLIALLKEKRQAVISQAVTKGLDPNVPMKNSGVEWLGDVPAHWKVGRCGYYLDILSGFAFPSDGFSSDEADTRLLRGLNVGVAKIRWDETVYWRRHPDDRLERYELQSGDLVLGMDRPWISEGVRVAQIAPKDVPCLLLQRVARLATTAQLKAGYLFWFLATDFFVHHFGPEFTGVSVPHISPEQIADFQVPLPPAVEQKSIVDYIHQNVTAIDQLKDEVERAIVLLLERRAALISAAVTGKIDVRDHAATEQAAA